MIAAATVIDQNESVNGSMKNAAAMMSSDGTAQRPPAVAVHQLPGGVGTQQIETGTDAVHQGHRRGGQTDVVRPQRQRAHPW